MLRGLGAEVREVRAAVDLVGLDGLVIPGGESTTISMGIESAGLGPAIRAHRDAGGTVFGTCAGMIVCDDAHLGLIDATVVRNAFGRQLQSFEADLEVEGLGDEPLRAVFIRAPWVERRGDGVEVLASYEGHPVAIREDRVLACAFHPELTDDSRLHALFMAMTTSCARVRARGGGDVRDPRAENLAKILVGYSTKVKEGEVVSIDGEVGAEPLLRAVYEEVLKAGAHPILNVALDGLAAIYYEHASDAQLEWISPLTEVDGRERRRADRHRRQRQHPRTLGGPAGAPDPPPDRDGPGTGADDGAQRRRRVSAGATRSTRPTPTPPRPR